MPQTLAKIHNETIRQRTSATHSLEVPIILGLSAGGLHFGEALSIMPCTSLPVELGADRANHSKQRHALVSHQTRRPS